MSIIECTLLKMAKNYSVATTFVLLQTEFSSLKAVSMRIRGSRKKIKSFSLKDGAILTRKQLFENLFDSIYVNWKFIYIVNLFSLNKTVKLLFTL